jgi:hypothetical protein
VNAHFKHSCAAGSSTYSTPFGILALLASSSANCSPLAPLHCNGNIKIYFFTVIKDPPP